MPRNNRVFEVDRHGKERWAIVDVQSPVDAGVLPGDHVLIAERYGSRITERDFKSKLLWSKEGLSSPPVNVQRLGNGNTFIALQSQLLEVDRNSKEVYTINKVPGGVLAAYRARNGHVIALMQNSECVIMDTTCTARSSTTSWRSTSLLSPSRGRSVAAFAA